MFSLSAGTRLGPYEIERRLGPAAWARYTRRGMCLDRTFAIKVSHERFSERFEREARALAGRTDVLDQYAPLSMTSSHAGNPVCCAAALASVDLILNERLAERARETGAVLHQKLNTLASRFPQIACVAGKGLVADSPVRGPAQSSRTPIWGSKSWSAPCAKAC